MEIRKWLYFAVVVAGFLRIGPASAEPIAVRHPEGIVHGFLTLKALDGTLVATGDLAQDVRGDLVTTRLTYRFKDGSIQDETTVYSQRGHFKLVTDHLVQKGPAFPQPLDMSIDAASGSVTVHYQDDKGKQQVEAEHFDLPPDIANGLVLTLLKNVAAGSEAQMLSYVAPTPKPRLVKLAISSVGADPFSIAGTSRKATHYVVKVDLGGVAGVVAPIIGKQPPDTHVWIMGGATPAFVKSEGPLFNGGDPHRTELTSPVWPKASAKK